ncbi:MAG: iron-sulfur cluster assembly scaffold protein [Dehalococcoidales bacterium]|nr:MAG: iron-sulfur cluster assembly scaffold protein [Dehalococcoidales bacterium]
MVSELDDTEKRALDEMRRIYTETVVDHALYPRNFGNLPDADGFASITTDGGDTIKMWLRVKDNRVVEAAFSTDACAATIASMSMITGLVRDKTITEALVISQQDVLEALGGLPEGNVHCALQAVGVLREVLKDYHTIKKEPWKKTYRQY